ncbi:hypothetical protein ACP70R_023832 [Stipagrostis hirtigluma subsp. patula]
MYCMVMGVDYILRCRWQWQPPDAGVSAVIISMEQAPVEASAEFGGENSPECLKRLVIDVNMGSGAVMNDCDPPRTETLNHRVVTGA